MRVPWRGPRGSGLSLWRLGLSVLWGGHVGPRCLLPMPYCSEPCCLVGSATCCLAGNTIWACCVDPFTHLMTQEASLARDLVHGLGFTHLRSQEASLAKDLVHGLASGLCG